MKIYRVGGAVRDQLMGRECVDVDYVVTGATPEQMLALGHEQVGASFPVFLHPGTREEYALARTETKTGQGYLGFTCAFGPEVTIEQDLYRRDLTINAIAWDSETNQYIDPYGGMADIQANVLRHVSDAFADDPLRVVRLARFSARFPGFAIAAETVAVAREIVLSGAMDELPHERYWAELRKVFSDKQSKPSRFFLTLHQFDAFRCVDFFRVVYGTSGYTTNGYTSAMLTSLLTGKVRFDDQYSTMDTDLAVAIHTVWTGWIGVTDRGPAAPTRVTNLAKMYCVLRDADVDATGLYTVVAAARALTSVTPVFNDLLTMLTVQRRSGWAAALVVAQRQCESVSSAPYLALPPVEIGKALMAARIAAIDQALQ